MAGKKLPLPFRSKNPPPHPRKRGRVLGEGFPAPSPQKNRRRNKWKRANKHPTQNRVGVFSNPNCTGDPIGPRPKMHDNGHCHKLSPPDPKKAKSWLGISWGSDHLDFDQLYLYQWQDCSIGRTQIDRYPGQESFCEEFPIGTVAVVNANGVY